MSQQAKQSIGELFVRSIKANFALNQADMCNVAQIEDNEMSLDFDVSTDQVENSEAKSLVQERLLEVEDLMMTTSSASSETAISTENSSASVYEALQGLFRSIIDLIKKLHHF